MKIFKLPILAFSMLAIFSCSTEESTLQDENITEVSDLNADLSLYNGTSQGLYKGVFSTSDSETRATVEIKVISDTRANALTIDTDGVVEFYEGTVLTDSEEVGIAFTSPRSSFNFTVSDIGENPIITDAVSDSKPSFITVVKEQTRDAVVPITGTYVTDDEASSGTWSVIFNSGDGEDADMDITTQTIFNGTDFGSPTGSSQQACVAVGLKEDCPISGNYVSRGVDITWSGEHTFLDRIDCSSLEGTWFTDNGLSGTFEGDSNCNGTGEVIITEYHNRPQRPSADEMTAAIPNNPGSAGNTDLRDDGTGQEIHAEWFEIYNTTDGPVVMDGWLIEDASGTGSSFPGTIDSFTIQAGEYAVFTQYNIPAAHGGLVFDYVYSYGRTNLSNESSFSDVGDNTCPDGIILTNASGVLVDQVLYDYGYGEYLGNAGSSTRCTDNDIVIGFPGQSSNSRVSFQLVNDPATMNSADNDDAANWSFSTNEYDADNGQDGTPGAANDPRI